MKRLIIILIIVLFAATSYAVMSPRWFIWFTEFGSSSSPGAMDGAIANPAAVKIANPAAQNIGLN